ncbi:beta-eliminating lyase-related protein, partial [Azonexus sp.]|uniref:beta-eliminating lyase-related protein n=1 Tax=Azonexus sp. TaxID=1872668 RepID=UPI0028308EB3
MSKSSNKPQQNASPAVRFFSGETIPLEMHKVRVVQKLTLPPIEERLAAIRRAGFNTFLLKTRDVYLDMLTDSGTNAMSDTQMGAMMQADDAYAGSQSFERMQAAIEEVFGKRFVLPAHQGRAAENIIFRSYVKSGDLLPMNYHFTTTLAHIELNGGKIAELLHDEALQIKSSNPFKG